MPWRLAAALVMGLAAGVAHAQSPADAVVRQLREQGYVEFAVSRTLLGRVRVIALAPERHAKRLASVRPASRQRPFLAVVRDETAQVEHVVYTSVASADRRTFWVAVSSPSSWSSCLCSMRNLRTASTRATRVLTSRTTPAMSSTVSGLVDRSL